MANTYFSEEQPFAASPLIYVFAASALAGLVGVGFAVIEEINTPSDDRLLLITVASVTMTILFVIAWALFSMRLITTISDSEITYRMPPMVNKHHRIPLNAIESAEVITYRPLFHYGGYGVRHSFRRGKALMVKGNKGVKIVLKSGKKLLIGTQQPDRARDAIHKMLKKRS